MHPRAVALERDDRSPTAADEHLAVVGDHQHGLLGRADRGARARAWPARRGSCRARRAAARRRRRRTARRARAACALRRTASRAGRSATSSNDGADDPPAGRVPLALELIAAERRPVRDRLPELHARRRRRRPRAGPRARACARRRCAHGERRQRQQQLADRALVVADADVLGHVADEPADGVPRPRRA